MKNFSIFVEGDGDKRFIEDYLRFLSIQEPRLTLPEDWKSNIYIVKGWTNLDSSTGEVHHNNMMRTTRKGGINLVIFDADKDAISRKEELEQIKEKYGLSFELFLFPNDKDSGAIEELLEQVINPQNQSILDCWKHYEAELAQQHIAWKNPPTPTSPSSKSKIYAYLEALVGESRSEKDQIKDPKRDYLNTNHWDLTAKGLIALKDFLLANLL